MSTAYNIIFDWMDKGWLLSVTSYGAGTPSEYDVLIVPSRSYATIPKPRNAYEVFLNTMAFQLLRRKQKSGEWEGTIVVEK